MNLKLKKILARVFSIGMIIVLLLFINSLVGNPVSNALAKKAAQQYIDTNYSNLDLKIEKCAYNFKFGLYIVVVQSSISKDTTFSVNVGSFGNVLEDNYESEVANNFTTFRRLDKELEEIANNIIGGNLSYDFDYISLRFVEDGDLKKLNRDMKLDAQNPPLPLLIDVVLFSDDVSYNKIAEVAKKLETILYEHNISPREYSILIIPLSDKPQNQKQQASWVHSLSVSYFPANRLTEENLPKAMEQFETNRVTELNEKYKK